MVSWIQSRSTVVEGVIELRRFLDGIKEAEQTNCARDEGTKS